MVTDIAVRLGAEWRLSKGATATVYAAHTIVPASTSRSPITLLLPGSIASAGALPTITIPIPLNETMMPSQASQFNFSILSSAPKTATKIGAAARIKAELVGDV